MELREYLEQDMVRFLDARLSVDFLKSQSTGGPRIEESAAALLHDYEAELFGALKQHNVQKAKHVLHEVKEAFNAHPVGSVERKQLQTLLHSLYEKFKQYLEDESTFDKLEDAIDHVETPESAMNEMNAPTKLSRAGAAVTDADIDNEFLSSVAQLENTIEQGDLAVAHTQYRALRRSYKSLSPDHKKKYHDHLLDLHKKIMQNIGLGPKTAESTSWGTHSMEQHNQPLPAFDEPHEQPNAIDSGGFGIEKKEQDLKDAMNEGQLHEAMIHYEELRSLVLALTQTEQQQWALQLHTYYDQLMTSWNQWKKNQEHTTADTPNVPAPSTPESKLLEQHERSLSGKP